MHERNFKLLPNRGLWLLKYIMLLTATHAAYKRNSLVVKLNYRHAEASILFSQQVPLIFRS